SCSRAEHSAPPSAVLLISVYLRQISIPFADGFSSPRRLGCEELAAHFLSQEIDGQALLLLREEHLISTMNIKLGPALKICASINSLRE
uniref:SAM domain-containing protein n=1 Tax=Nothobranchius furzeri TaxID=105023 RepID=A0A8C6KJY1_NOTFU